MDLRGNHVILDLYEKILAHVSGVWPELTLVNNKLISEDGTPFYAHSTTHSLPFIIKNGLCYGHSTAIRTSADVYAGVDVDGVRTPCGILAHFKVAILDKQPQLFVNLNGTKIFLSCLGIFSEFWFLTDNSDNKFQYIQHN